MTALLSAPPSAAPRSRSASPAPRREAGAIRFIRLASPVGALYVAAEGERLVAVGLAAHPDRREAGWREIPADEAGGALAEARRQLEEYFAGTRTAFDLPLACDGTPFQQAVWAALRAIPFGETASYGEIARRVGRPGASRAVGRANHENPFGIVVPCHRVIGADGRLVGYGGGLPMKEALLAHEARVLAARAGSIAARPAAGGGA